MGKQLRKCNSVGGGRSSGAKALTMTRSNRRMGSEKDEAQVSSYLQLRSRTLVLMPLLQKKRRKTKMKTKPLTSCEKAVVANSGHVERISSRRENSSSGESETGVRDEKREEWSRSICGGQEEQEVEGLESNSCDVHYCNNEERRRRRRRKRESTPSSALRGDHNEEEEEPEFENLESRNEPSSGRPARKKPEQTPSEAEIDEFFAVAEKDQMKKFMEKYNYDVVKDKPVEGGRYEWVKVSP